MATYSNMLRQGLPRTPGGEPWPAPDDAPAWASEGIVAGAVSTPALPAAEATPAIQEPTPETVSAVSSQTDAPTASTPTPAVSTSAATGERVIRRGLPRVAGGEPWPATGALASEVPVAAPASETAPAPAPTTDPTPVAAVAQPAAESAQPAPAPAPQSPAVSGGGGPIRQGLPRASGGEPWPAAGEAPAWTVKTVTEQPEPVTDPSPSAESVAETVVVSGQQAAEAEQPAPSVAGVATAVAATGQPPASQPKPEAAQPAAKSAAPATKPAKPAREPIVWRGKTIGKWIQLALLWGGGAVIVAAIFVLAGRGVTTLPGVPEWMERYPGHYDLPESAEPGFPWWARWSHAFNIFLIAMIIQSGLRVRNQQQPPAFYTPKKGGKKVSINLWLHTSLDVLWVVNGLVFVVLLFVTGHWMRIVPTSWEVFPNALSAGLQYLTLDWPAEHGWVNYNGLQQLMYFVIVFIAAPVAIITGARMSEWWPKNAEKLNKFYPAPLARALHFPTMIFFALFIVAHVAIVFATGALRNLNHMFAGQDVVSWTGFWLFALTIFITAVLLWATRPLILAPIANLFGRVSNR